jgi:hypothetical protein
MWRGTSRAAVAVSALALSSGLSAHAGATEPITVRIGGKFEQWGVLAAQRVGTGDGTDIDTNLLDQKHNSDLRFTGTADLDHSLRIGLIVELEANTDDSQIGESYLFVAHPRWGALQVGDTDNAPVNMHVAAPDGGVSINDGDLVGIDAFVLPEGFESGDTLIDSTALQLGDDTSGKFVYYTPRIAGFQLGLTYTPQFEDGGSDNTSISRQGNEGPVTHGVAIGLSYEAEFDEVEIEAYAGYLFGNTPSANGTSSVQGVGLGIVLDIADVEIGGSVAWANGDVADEQSVDGFAFDVGMAFEVGDYRFGIAYIKGVSEGSRADSNKQHLDQAVLSGTCILGPGVELVGGLFFFDADGENELVAGSDGVKSNRGYGFTTGFKLTF